MWSDDQDLFPRIMRSRQRNVPILKIVAETRYVGQIMLK
jgi:hypothetical protein